MTRVLRAPTLLLLGGLLGCSQPVGPSDDDDAGEEWDCPSPRDWWPDADDDTYGDEAVGPTRACDPPEDSWVARGGDCADADPIRYPFATEICNDVDDDCDGEVDDGLTLYSWRPDVDLDRFGDALVPAVESCVEEMPGLTREGGDCDDLDPARYPGAEEFCDAIDSDCDDDFVDGDLDTDGDGTPDCEDWDDDGDGDGDLLDCEPLNGAIGPGLPETCGDLVDNDCDPTTLCYEVEQGPQTWWIQPLVGTVDVLDWYSYGTPFGASANSGFEISDETVELLYVNPPGVANPPGLYLVVIHDLPEDGSGGSVQMFMTGLSGASQVQADDPGEGGDVINGEVAEATMNWNWIACCTDGTVVGPLAPYFYLMLDFTSWTGVNGISTYDGSTRVQLGNQQAPVYFRETQ